MGKEISEGAGEVRTSTKESTNNFNPLIKTNNKTIQNTASVMSPLCGLYVDISLNNVNTQNKSAHKPMHKANIMNFLWNFVA